MKTVICGCLVAGLCLSLGAGVSLAAEQPSGPCLKLSQVKAARLSGDHALVVQDYSGRSFLVRINGWCHDLSWETWSNVSANAVCLSPGDWLPSSGGTQPFHEGAPVLSGHRSGATRCIVTKVEFYAPDTADSGHR